MASSAITSVPQAVTSAEFAGYKSFRFQQNLQNITVAFLFLYALAQPASIAATHVFYAGAAFSWILRVAITRGRTLRSSPLDLPILVYLVLAAISTVYSPFQAASWEGMRKVALVCAVLVFAHNVVSLDRAKQIINTLFFAGLVSVAWAFWLYGHGVGLRVVSEPRETAWYRDGLRPSDTILAVDGHRLTTPQQFTNYLYEKSAAQPLTLSAVPIDGIEVSRNAKPDVLPPGDWPKNAESSDQLGLKLETARPARAFGFYAHYVTYSGVLALLASLVFGFWLGLPERFSARGLLVFAVFCAFSLALGMTLTRAAWLSLALACVVQIWFHSRRWSVRVLLPIVLVASVFVTDAAMHRWRGTGLVDFNDPGTDFRILMWKDGLRLIAQHPWVGVGMNAVRDYWPLFDMAAYRKYALRSHFHSTPIQIAVELGIPALIAWIAFMAVYWRMLVQLVARAREKDAWSYGFALGTLGATSGFLASSVVHYDFGDTNVVFLFWLLAGIALAVRQQLAPKGIP